MRKIKLLILTICIIAFSVNAFSNTTISYSGNVSAEFLNAKSYNRLHNV